MKAVNYVQLALACALAGATAAAATFPSLAFAMHLVIGIGSGALTTLNMYAPPPSPGAIVGPSGMQTIHLIQVLIGTIVGSVSFAVTAFPKASLVANLIAGIGTVLLAVLGVISPQAIETSAMRARRMARAVSQQHELGETLS